jgi:hypothetical protein
MDEEKEELGTEGELEEGQTTSEDEEPEETETEEPEKKQAAPKEPESAPEDEEKTRVQKRIDELTWRARETERKLELFKTDPDKYYETYPGERPEGYKGRQEKPEEQAIEDYETMVIKGGPYDGMTLGDLAVSKPLTAHKMLNDYLDGQRRSAQEIEERKVLSRRAWENDVNSFGAHLSQEVFGKSKDDLSEDEFHKITEQIWQVDQWKKANRKESYSYNDAYALMNRENELKQAKQGGANKVIEALKKSPIGSVSGKTDQSRASIDYDSMSESVLGEHLSRMNDAEAEKFYREAPKSLKEKYPSWPWS